MSSTELVAKQRVPLEAASAYGDVHISGSAIVQLGDRYGSNKDLFEAGSEAERRNGKHVYTIRFGTMRDLHPAMADKDSKRC